MPELDPKVIARRGEIARALRRIVGEDAVIDHPDGLAAYESDGLGAVLSTLTLNVKAKFV